MISASSTQPQSEITSMSMDGGDVLLKASNITKVYPGTIALDEVDFNVYRGKVNVLVGENGAGKSTLMKILAGVVRATEGELVLDGEPIEVKSPHDAERYGIGIIYQEMNLFPNLSVSENIFMARELVSGGMVIRANEQRERTRDLMERMEQPIDADALVSNLRIGQQQIIEIAKALAQDVRILIMDEPTSALSNAEVDILFRVIRELKSNGVSIVYISHKLDELLQIGDYVTVLRDGKMVAEESCANIDVPWIVEQMVGKNPDGLFMHEAHEIGEELLRIDELTILRLGGGYTLDHVSLSVHRGEILGLYGLMGAGRSELFECLAGIRDDFTGEIWLEGSQVRSPSIQKRIQMGLTLVPEDRQRDGLVQSMSVANNMLLSSLKKYLNVFYLSRKKEKETVVQSVKDLAVKVADPNHLITSLSGGNQQKVVVAKSLLTNPKVLLLDEPSRGIDVAAKSEIFEIMNQLANQGFAIIFASSELKEIIAVADRILVLSKGAITGEFAYGEGTEEALVAASAVGHGASK